MPSIETTSRCELLLGRSSSNARKLSEYCPSAALDGRPETARITRHERRVSPNWRIRITGVNLSRATAGGDLHSYLENRRWHGGASIQRYSLQHGVPSLFMVIRRTLDSSLFLRLISTVSSGALSLPLFLSLGPVARRPRSRDQQVGPPRFNFVFHRGVSRPYSIVWKYRQDQRHARKKPILAWRQQKRPQKRPQRNVEEEKNCFESNRR